MKYYTVSEVARLTHLTVRALHHYDEIGLLRPSQRSGGGYRLYSESDLQRLQQALLFRELGFGLDAVSALLHAPDDQRCTALVEQRGVLLKQREHVDAVLRAVDATLQSLLERKPMTTEKLFEGNEQFENAEYAKKAEAIWGGTASWQESHRRTKSHSREDWQRIQSESEALNAEFASTMQSGLPNESDAAMALAERHRLHIDRWFYACSYVMQLRLAKLYEGEERFRDHYNRHANGLADYVIAAIRANAVRHT